MMGVGSQTCAVGVAQEGGMKDGWRGICEGQGPSVDLRLQEAGSGIREADVASGTKLRPPSLRHSPPLSPTTPLIQSRQASPIHARLLQREPRVALESC